MNLEDYTLGVVLNKNNNGRFTIDELEDVLIENGNLLNSKITNIRVE